MPPATSSCPSSGCAIWCELRQSDCGEIVPAAEGLLKSGVFPGLWLDAAALLRGDLKAVLAALRRGLNSPHHAQFVSTNLR